MIDQLNPESRVGESASRHQDHFSLPLLLDVRPSSEFYYDTAKSKLLNLRFGEDDGTRLSLNVPGESLLGNGDSDAHGQQCQLLRLAGWVDIESRVTVSYIVGKATIPLTYSLGRMCWSSSLISATTTVCCIPTGRRCSTYDVPYLIADNVQSAGYHVR